MKYGLVLPNYSAWFTPDNIRATLNLAEELGYESAWVNDHVFFPGNLASHYGNEFLDPLSLLAYMAAASEKLILATTILVVPYRPAIPTAKMLASTDRLSNGRLLIGIGVGHEPTESEALGIPYNERGRMTDEYMRCMVELWTKDVATFKGRYDNFTDVKPLMPPIQRPHPPFTIGGNGEHAMRRMKEFNAGWHPTGSAERITAGIKALREFCEKESMAWPEVSVRWSVHVTSEGDPNAGGISPTSVGEARRPLMSPAQTLEEIANFEALGVSRLVLNIPPNRGMYLDQMKAFAAVAM